jgi:putative intracellular protease/amidase
VTASPAAVLATGAGAVVVVSAWLPWYSGFGQSFTAMDVAGSLNDLANANYLILGGFIALICGIVMLLGTARNPALRPILAVGAIVGGVLAVAVEATAYNDVSGQIGSSYVSYGIYVGLAAGVVAVVGGLIGLRQKA